MSTVPETKLPLRFSADGKYKILTVSDIHGGHGFAADETHAAIEALVASAKPDIVLMIGDIIGPGIIHAETPEHVREVLDVIAEPMERRGIPWAHVFGNHDDNFGVSNETALGVYMEYPHCISYTAPGVPGWCNHCLKIYDAEGKDNLFAIYGFDLVRNAPEATLSFEQAVWYWSTSIELEREAGHKVPAVMYMHVPIPEMRVIAFDAIKHRLKGLKLDPDGVCSAPTNSGIFAACLERGDVRGIIFGHDHENDFQGEYHGITLAYDGFCSYHACHNESIRGGRIIELDSADLSAINTYMIRVKDVL